MGPSNLAFSFPVSPPPFLLCNHSFQGYQNPVKRGGYTLLLTIVFRPSKILLALRADIPVAFRAT